ncbi:MAG: SRPBCC family protein [Candidatus Limnocylindrales bacterium]
MIESVRDAVVAPADVFRLYADPSTWSEWGHNAKGSNCLPHGAATHRVCRSRPRPGNRRLIPLTEFLPGQRLAYRTTGGPFPFSGSFETGEGGGGTRITATFEATPTGAFALVGPLFTRLVCRKFGRDLRNLKRLMEAGELW